MSVGDCSEWTPGSGLSPSVVVLLVEDDQATREALGWLFDDEGIALVEARNGREGLELLRSGISPSVILLDVMMPVMDGWDFRHAQLCDPNLKEIPVVVITATGFSPQTIRKQFGDVEVVSKPIRPDAILDAITRSCGPSAR